jgi:hypothetical protein
MAGVLSVPCPCGDSQRKRPLRPEIDMENLMRECLGTDVTPAQLQAIGGADEAAQVALMMMASSAASTNDPEFEQKLERVVAHCREHGAQAPSGVSPVVLDAIKALHGDAVGKPSNFTVEEDTMIYTAHKDFFSYREGGTINVKKKIKLHGHCDDQIANRVKYLRSALNRMGRSNGQGNLGDTAFQRTYTKHRIDVRRARGVENEQATPTPPVRESSSNRSNRNTGKEAGLRAQYRSGGRERAGDAAAKAVGS